MTFSYLSLGCSDLCNALILCPNQSFQLLKQVSILWISGVRIHLVGSCHLRVEGEGGGLLPPQGRSDELPGGGSDAILLQMVDNRDTIFTQ